MTTVVKYAIRSAAGWASMTSAEQAEYAGYFETLSAWAAIIPTDISAATGTDEQWIAESYNDWTDGLEDRVILPKVVGSETNNIIIRGANGVGTAGPSKANGDPDVGFLLTWNVNWETALKAYSFTSIFNIRVQSASSGGYACISLDATDNPYTTIAKGVVAILSNIPGMILRRSTAFCCKSYACSTGFISTANYFGYEVFNCIAVDCDTGFYGHAGANNRNEGVSIINCISTGCNTDYNILTAYSAQIGHCATDNIANTEAWVTIKNITDSDFIDVANNDYHLSATSQLKSAGLNLIVNPPNLSSPQYDIDGDQWPDTGAWDIGFDYFATSSGNTYSHASTGGITTGGTAIASIIKAVTVTGGTTLGGSAKTATVKAFFSFGGIVTGGAAVTSKVDAATSVYMHVASGGVLLAGAAKVSTVKSTVSSGGISVSGSADIIQIKQYLAGGGITTGGSAVTQKVAAGTNIYTHTASGGTSVSGQAKVIQIKDYLSSGGTATGGAAITKKVAAATSTYQHVSSGGVSLSGSAKVIQIRRYLASGGITIAGSAVTFSNNTQVIDLELVEIEWHSDTTEAVFANDKYGIALK